MGVRTVAMRRGVRMMWMMRMMRMMRMVRMVGVRVRMMRMVRMVAVPVAVRRVRMMAVPPPAAAGYARPAAVGIATATHRQARTACAAGCHLTCPCNQRAKTEK